MDNEQATLEFIGTLIELNRKAKLTNNTELVQYTKHYTKELVEIAIEEV